MAHGTQQFQSNQFNNNIPIKGDTAMTVGFNVMPVLLDPNSTAILVPGDAVVLTTTTGTAILVDKATASEIPWGFVLYETKNNTFSVASGNVAFEIARFGTLVWAEADGSITRGDDLEYVPDTVTNDNPLIQVSLGVNPICGVAVDNATDGQLFRMMIITAMDFAPTISGGTINNAPIGQSIPNLGKFTALSSVVTALTPGASISIPVTSGNVFTLVPGGNETITPASQIAGQLLLLEIVTSGTTGYTLTFGSGFTGLSELWTGTTSGVKSVLTFISDGTAYVFQTDLTKAIYALASAATIALDPSIANIMSHVPTQNETINTATLPVAGDRLTFVITTSGTTSYTLTFGTNFKSVGTLATGATSGKVFTIQFISDGVNLNELSRTTAM